MMHLKTLLLLAVHSNVIIAGVLRRGHFARSGVVYLRSFNQSAINDAAGQPLDSVSPTSLSVPQATLAPITKQVGSVPAVGSGPGAAEIDGEANTQPPQPLITNPPSFSPQASLAITAKQIGSVPAAGSGPGAAKIDEADIVSANTEPPKPLITTSSISSAKDGQDLIAITSKQIGEVPAVGSGPDAATLPAAQVISANTKPPVLLSSTAIAITSKQIGKVPAVGSGPDAATLPAAQVISANTKPPVLLSSTAIALSTTSVSSLLRQNKTISDIPASTSSSGPPVAPVITSIPVAGASNIAMANTFNQFFDSMNADSSCNPVSQVQRMACIDKKTAVCGADGKYQLSACSQNEICRAVPLDGTQTGIAIKCVPEADTSPASPSKSAEAAGVETSPPQQTTVPAQATKTTPILSSVSKASQTKTVVSAVSPLSSLERRPPRVIFTTQTTFVTIRTGTSSLLRVSPEAKNTPRPSPKSSDQPAIVIVPESRRGPETTPVRVKAFNPPRSFGPVTVTQTVTVTATAT